MNKFSPTTELASSKHARKRAFAPGFAIAIDGPVGVGKSTTAKLAAKLLGITYIDTGALYRAVAYFALQNNVMDTIADHLQDINIELRHVNEEQRIILNGQDISDEIRTQPIADATSLIAANKAVRAKLLPIQQKIAQESAVIMDGRDIASHVLPWAQLKIYLDADVEIRARRRMNDLISRGQEADFEQILQETILRDSRDKTREISPLIQAEGAIRIDTGDMTPQEVAERIKELAYVL